MTERTLTLEYAPPVAGCTICAHAFAEYQEDGVTHSEYVDSGEPGNEGAPGCVYLRTPADESAEPFTGGEFDIPAERDFPTYAEAEQFAAAYAERHGVPLNNY